MPGQESFGTEVLRRFYPGPVSSLFFVTFNNSKTYVIFEDCIMRKGLFVIMVSTVLYISLFNILSLNCYSEPVGWSEDIRLTNNSNSSTLPVVGVWENYVHVFWCEREPEPPTTTRDIYYQRSSDGGKTWDRPNKLIDSPYNSIKPSIAINQNRIHMVWKDDRLANSAIFYTRSEDNGTTWIPEINITIPNGGTGYPDIAVNGNNIHVVYMLNFKVYYVNSTDNGISWSKTQQLTGSIRDSDHPSVAVNGSNIHIVWLDHYDKNGQVTNGAIFYMNSTDSGLTWSEDINLTEMDLDAAYPYVVVNGSIIHVAYSKEIAGLWQGYYRSSEDNGITWTKDIKILNSSTDIGVDSISIENDVIHVVGGDDYISDKQIYYVRGYNNGQNWDPQIRLTFSPGDSQLAKILAYEKKIHIIWNDYRDGNPEIYYKYYPYYPPPTNLTIDILGPKLILNWTAPQTGLSPVDHYLIFRSTIWDGFNFAFPWVNTSIDNDNGIIPLRTSWNDSIALLDETYNYYYVVRAVYENGEIDINENIVGKFVIPLNSGWNLISLPLAQNDTRIPEALKSIEGKYNIIYWYDAKNGIWRSSSTSLTDINRTMGLWIHMKNACNLSIVSTVPESTDIALYEGWNLVGYPSLKTRNLNDAINGINWLAVQQYDAFYVNNPWKHNSTKKPINLNDLKKMQPGRGYWVYVTINDTWVRTRTVEDNKVVIWRVSESEEKVLNNQLIYEPTIENSIEMKDNDDFQFDIIPEESAIKYERNNFTFSLIPLIILIAFVLAEIRLLHKLNK